MSAPSAVIHETKLDDIGSLVAYENQSVKANFSDRTIIRMQKDCNIVRILNKRGDELMLNLSSPSEVILNEYFQYIRVVREFLEHVFSTE